MTAIDRTPARPHRRRPTARQFWMKQLHSWHWVSAALSLIGMVLFAVTGLTLNHAATIAARPVVATKEGRLTPGALSLLGRGAGPLPAPVAAQVADQTGIDPAGIAAEWSDADAYVALPGPGRDAWVSIDRATGVVTAERTDRGWVSYLNDLHKGRNTGDAWFWFIDLFAVACIVFTVTGLLLLQLHAARRPTTWPLVAVGTAVPVLIALFLIH